jgi:serine/threonine protein kinase
MIGETISHHRIIEKLGEGGMGVVHKATDAKLDSTVALKFLSPSLLESDEAKRRGHSFIAMEYVEGESLVQKVRVRENRTHGLKRGYGDGLALDARTAP